MKTTKTLGTLERIEAYQQTLTYKFWATDKHHMTTMVQSDAWGWRGLPPYYPHMRNAISGLRDTFGLFCIWRDQAMRRTNDGDYGRALQVAA